MSPKNGGTGNGKTVPRERRLRVLSRCSVLLTVVTLAGVRAMGNAVQ